MQFSNHRSRAARGSIVYLAVDAIAPSAVQPRQNFSPAQLEELSRSIAEYGVLSPLTVRPRQGGYELVAGERRLRAARMAGLQRGAVHHHGAGSRGGELHRAGGKSPAQRPGLSRGGARHRAAHPALRPEPGGVRAAAGQVAVGRGEQAPPAAPAGGCAQRHAQRRTHRAARPRAAAP